MRSPEKTKTADSALEIRLAGLSPEKRALVLKKLREKGDINGPGPLAGPDAVSQIASHARDNRLSFAQERLWVLGQLEGPSSTYNVPAAVRLEGPLDRNALEGALNEIVRRHEALRTAFVIENGLPAQKIAPELTVRLPITEMGAVPVADRYAAALRKASDDAARPFDLASPPLFRAGLYRVAPDDHLFAITFHHIIADAWSIGVFVRELSALYEAHLRGAFAALSELPIQYVDYATWQRTELSGGTLAREVEHWRKRLEGAPPAIDLPTDRPRPSVATSRGRTAHFEIDAQTAEKLRGLALASGGSLFMALLAAFHATLARWSGQEEIVIGTPIAGRTRRETEGLIGFFVNTLPVRVDGSGTSTFRELLERVRAASVEAFSHQTLPFEKLVEEIFPERDAARPPIFQVVFAMQTAGRESLAFSGLKATPVAIETGTAKFEMTLIIEEHDRRLEGVVEYNSDLWDPATIARFVAHLRNMVRAMAEDSDRRVADVEILGDEERRKLLEWSGGCEPASSARAATIGELFAEVAAVSPDAVALESENGVMTYAGLDAAANRLAHHLRALGVGPDTIVGLSLERSPELVVAILAILKAGGAYVPFDPEYPKERIAFMLEDTAARIVVTTSRYRNIFESSFEDGRRIEGGETPPLPNREGAPRAIVEVDTFDASILPSTPPPDVVSAENLAYVMYTSGSTGRPKGVCVPHRAVVRLVRGADFAAFGADQTFLLFAPISFDASTLELWGPLLNGGRLAIAPPTTPSLAELGEIIRSRGVTTLWLTSSLFNLMVEERLEDLGELRQLLAGGDALSPPHVERFTRRHPGVRLINGYGPTENTTFTCCHSIDPGTPVGASIPIGRPIAGTFVRILDRNGALAPIGVPGELCAGGDGLARGYWNRPELTTERFLNVRVQSEGAGHRPAPTGERNDANVGRGDPAPTNERDDAKVGRGDAAPTATLRLYRTGDRARWRADGVIEFMGRFDDQVKIRGFRVEPGEVEAQILRVPGVSAAVVVVRKDRAGRKILVAYFAGVTTAADVESQLRSRLPEHMIPSALVALESLPLNRNGKVDRARLPEPDERPASANVEPRTETERELAAIWRAVLQIETVGATDDFFAIGGNSLVATQLMSRVRDRFEVAIPLRAIFEAPTIGELAVRVDAARAGLGSASTTAIEDLGGRGDPAPTIAGKESNGRRDPAPTKADTANEKENDEAVRPVPRHDAMPLSYAQERLWFLNQLEPDNSFYNVAVSLRVRGRLDVAALEECFREITRRHEILRTVYRKRDGKPVQIILPAIDLSIPVIDLTDAENLSEEIERRAITEARAPFDLENGPVLRAQVLAIGSDDHALFVTMHHIVSDGWSMGIFIDEVAAHYAERVGRGDPAPTGVALGVGRGDPAPTDADAAAARRRDTMPIQYADFAVAQREWLQGERLARQLAYWREKLADHPTSLELPADRPRPPVQSFRGSSERFTLDRELTSALNELSRSSGATLFMTLLAGFSSLLARYSGRDDLVIGSPIANRTRSEIESLIGFFVNTLALRIDGANDPTFTELIERVKQASLEAFANQDLPFERIVDELQPERDLSRNPLFQVMFALQNAPLRYPSLAGLAIESIDLKRTTAQFDLVLDMWETETGMLGILEFSTDLFDPSTAGRIVGHFREILRAAVANPALRLSELPLMSEEERRRILEISTGPRIDLPIDRTLVEIFEDVVARGPDRIAGVHGATTITYAALNAKANRIAHRLRRAGVGRNDFVVLFEDRGIDLVAAILGVWKAGAAYVPVDPGYPDERVKFMIADAQAKAIVSRSALASRIVLEAQNDAASLVLFLDRDFDSESEKDPDRVNAPGDRAYMLYTSGSTGMPKGAIIRHDGKVNHIFGQFHRLAFHPDSAFLQTAPSSSDISVWQFVGPLMIGGRTVIADYETVCDPARLLTLIREERVTIIELVPAVLSALLEYAESRPEATRVLPHLEWAMVTGEAASVPLVHFWFRIYPAIRLVNAYGPTEAADDVCQSELDRPPALGDRSVTIGTPLPNLAVYVLDGNLALLPIGVPGEICVGGIGVGEGYWRREEKTAESFVPNPHAWGVNDSVLYKTGDLGRWRPDGALEFIGRVDQQVKIRGYRIELGEIEDAVARHPAIREATVIVREDRPGDARIVAYVTPSARAEGLDLTLEALESDQVTLWQDLHEKSYADTSTVVDPIFNTTGWDSTYTGQPLPDEEMREYVDHTVARVLALGRGRILEIGCGTGLLAYQVIPRCASYLGTDLSGVAVDRLAASRSDAALRARVPGLERASFVQKRAEDFSGIEAGSIDTLMLCSILQYFPGVDYLFEVLDGAMTAIAPGGSVFIGDVRSLALLEAYHASVQLHRAGDDVTREEFRRRVARSLTREPEIAYSPAFFAALTSRYPRVKLVEILPKRGAALNELTRYRYDVRLRLDTECASSSPHWEPWSLLKRSASEIERALREERPNEFALSGVASSRVAEDLRAIAWMRGAGRAATVAEWKRSLDKSPERGVDPEALRIAAQNTGYAVAFRLDPTATDGRYDVVFRRADASGALEAGGEFEADWTVKGFEPRPWAEYANNPLREKIASALVPSLRAHLAGRLPKPMTPSEIVVLSNMPVLPNGKIDRKALPEPDTSRAPDSGERVAPRTPAERSLAAIWCAVLGIESAGARDNFFELGGHSLKATQVVSRIHSEMGVEVALRDLFAFPTLEELAARIDKSDLRSDLPPIDRIPDAAHFAVSHAQRRIWVLSQMEESSIAYNMPAALRLDGPVAAEALAAAFDAVVGRHESLRTRFVEIDGEPRQIVSPIPLGRAEFADVSDFDDSEAEARRLANEDAATAFDLAQGPLVRMKLIRLGEESHALLFNMHHIISDEWSLRIFIREFMDAYGDVAAGRAFSRDSLKIQYRDFAAWQSALLASKDAEAHRDYWRGRFAEEAPILDLPLDFARPPLKTYCGRSLSFSIDRALTSGLEAFARARGASLYMALVAAVKVLLHRYTQQTDIVVGMPIAGRNRLDLEDQIGFYINALPLRSTLDSEAPFERTLAEISRNALGAYEHQIYPFDRLVDDLQIRRDVSRHPLFDVVVVMQNAGGDEFSLPGAAVTPLVDDYDVSKFDLQFSFEERGGEIAAAITWNTDLFVEERIVRMSRHFLELVRSLLRDPTEVISRLNILTDDERRAAASWVPAHVEPCGPETIAARFEAHAAADPNAPAVVFEDSEEAMPRITMTYGELNAAANRLAHRLRSLGVGPDGLVAVHLERSPRMVVALLGVLKAGGAYLPIDTAYPKDRVRFMLEDSGCRVLLTERGVLGDSSHLTEGVAVLTLDDADLGSESAENPEFLAGPEHLAYVIYTSGSTGLPKGCLVTNRNVTRLFDATDPWFGFNAQDAWSLFHSCAFDFSVWEIWGALLYGGRLVIIPYWVSRSPEAFHELMLREGVTVLNQTPSAFRQLIPIAVKAGRGDLRAVIFGGEALDIPGLRPWFEAFGDETPRLVNMYGITETTVHVTYRPITMKDCERPASVVGTPIPDLGIRIVDRHLEPVPTGIPGEILVGGAGVARGYLNRPELTSERFVRSAVVDGNASPRVEYRSGDLARRLFDGDIEYLGRIDHQVKIRGFRIELGEIEAALSRCDGVRGASVHHQKRPEGDRLVAWVEAAATVDPANLRESLRKRLPEYMIPAVIMPVDKFSLTANGKIDRRALPDPDAYASGAAASGGEAFAAPASGAEARIATVMQEILAVPRVSASANWFDLGAQSILLVRAHAKLQNAFGRKFPLLWLYQYPTIAALAAQLERGDGPDTKAAADSRAAAQDAEDRAAKQRESRAARRRPGGGDR